MGLGAKGHDIVVVCQPCSEMEARAREQGLPVALVTMRSQVDLLAVFRLRRVFGRVAADVVHLHGSRSHALGGLAARRARVPVVVAHKRTISAPRAGYLTHLRYECWVDRVICVSDAVSQATLQSGVRPEKLLVIHDSVDVDRFAPDGDKRSAKRALGYGPDDLLVAQVGQLCGIKGQQVLLAAAARARRSCPRARFVFCGEGPAEAEIRSQAWALGLAEAVKLLGFREDVRPVLAAADVVAMPSFQEGLGVAVLEAMAMGVPVVASRVGGLPEAVPDGETGLLVPPGDERELAEALLRLLADAGLRASMGTRGRELVERQFGRNMMVETIERLYRELAPAG
jgi:glycosyltransferase involved in cell wall biosynthesis